MMLSGADILVRTLIEQGVDTVFGYPGGQILNVYDSLYKYQSEITHVLTAHEQGATHAADGYARTTGKVGVVISTSGPGATNLVTGIATAYLDSIPMVALCGNVPTTQIGTDSFQEIDITGVTLPITKHNYFVGSVDELADTIREAFRLAQSGRPGPVLIDVPKDVQTALCEYEAQPPVTADPPAAAKELRVEQAATLINAARRPFVYFGGGLVAAGAQSEMLALAESWTPPSAALSPAFPAFPPAIPAFWACRACTATTPAAWPCTTPTSSSPWACGSTTGSPATAPASLPAHGSCRSTWTARSFPKTCPPRWVCGAT